jgi:hypothetical protein
MSRGFIYFSTKGQNNGTCSKSIGCIVCTQVISAGSKLEDVEAYKGPQQQEMTTKTTTYSYKFTVERK